MGNTSKKLAAKCTLLTKEEQRHVGATFRAASKNSERIREEDLIKFWGPSIDPRLAQYLSNFLFGWGPNKATSADFNRFAELYVHNVRGTVDQKTTLLYNCLGMELDQTIPYQLLKEYCESIASTYIKILKASDDRCSMWLDKGFKAKAANVQALGEVVAASVLPQDDNTLQNCQQNIIERWISTDMLLARMTEMVFMTLYFSVKRDDNLGPAPRLPSLLPAAEGISSMPDYPAVVDLSHLVWLNTRLPIKHQHKWRFLFSSHIHGESFSTLAGRIQEQGPSIVILQDNSGYVFGGFAAESWSLNPNWQGGEESFLFALVPRMREYPSSGFNNHYQYLNQHTKTLPNGLLMGGQFEFGGIWVNADPFGSGSCAESCSTYRGYRRLSKEPAFAIKSLEVWGVGDKPLADKDSESSNVSNQSSVLDTHKSEMEFLRIVGKTAHSDGYRLPHCRYKHDERDLSILDQNPEAKAMLDMVGKTMHSDGLREPPPL